MQQMSGTALFLRAFEKKVLDFVCSCGVIRHDIKFLQIFIDVYSVGSKKLAYFKLCPSGIPVPLSPQSQSGDQRKQDRKMLFLNSRSTQMC